jgi:lambda family phage portal protein
MSVTQRIRVPAGRRPYGASVGGISARAPGDYAEDSGAWAAASGSYRSTGWGAEHHDADSRLFGHGVITRARSRAAAAQNGIAKSGIEHFVSNAVGTGIVLRSAHPDPGIRQALHELFDDWAEESDAAGVCDWYGQQALATRAMLEGGEVLGRHRLRRPEDGLRVPYQLELIEPEHLPFHHNGPNGANRIKAGIEFDPLGRRAAYHLYRSHPGALAWDVGANDLVRVPADQVVHLFQPLRPGQSRGIPWLAWVLGRLSDIDEYDGAETVRKKTAAMFTAFVTSTDPEAMGQTTSDDRGFLTHLSPGTVQYLDPGESVNFAAPKDDSSYEAFMRSQLRSLAAGMGVTYEQLSSDLTGVNYSSIRAGLLEFRRQVSMMQHQVIIHQFCRPIWRQWLRSALLLHFPREFARQPDFRTWARARWMPPAWQWVDPEKDVKASLLAIQGGLTSRARVVAESGEDVETIDAEQKIDRERAEKMGLPYGGIAIPA